MQLTIFSDNILEIALILRFLRVLALLKHFTEFELIFITLDNVKDIFFSLIYTLLSFFFIFSSISTVFIGGTIKQDSFLKDCKYYLN